MVEHTPTSAPRGTGWPGCAPLARALAAVQSLAGRVLVRHLVGEDGAFGLHRHFTLVAATTGALREEAYRIRHAVYVDELGWEPPGAVTLERDAFDARARHLLLWHRGEQRFVGTVRLVLGRPFRPGHALPFEDCCLDSIPEPARSRLERSPERVGELSRIVLLAKLRRRAAAQRGAGAGQAALALYLGAAALVRCAGLPGAFGVLNPRHARRIRLLGFDAVRVGRVLSHRGPRAVYYLPAERLEQRLPVPLVAAIEEIEGMLDTSGWCDRPRVAAQ